MKRAVNSEDAMSWRETPRERLLTYRSMAEWADKENVPRFDDLLPADRPLFHAQYGELYRKLWNEHYEALPSEMKHLFETKEHPRFHYLEEIWELRGNGSAKKYLDQLQQHLEALGLTGLFKVTDSPFGDVRLAVLLDPPATREVIHSLIPQFFMGFEVILYPPGSEHCFQNADD